MQPQKDTSNSPHDSRDEAANLVRNQLEALYGNSGSHSNNDHTTDTPKQHAAHTPQDDYAQQYHAQWQDYYQKYYEQYYVGHLHKAIEEAEKRGSDPDAQRQEELTDLREKIVARARTSAKKARKSRHFIPIASALTVALVVAFLQYNQLLISTVVAYVSPGAIDPNNIIVDPTANVRVSAEPRLIIPKINVDVPVVYGVGYDQQSQLKAMEKGVAHFAIPGADSRPGQIGNTVLSGHSSNDLFDPGDYKFIFAQLEKMKIGDSIYVNYQSTRYSYTVTKKEVVLPTQVNKLIYPTDKPILTLITCTPLGTAEKRLLVTAEQTAPDPSKATKPSTTPTNNNNNDAVLTGDGPTLLERFFGG